MKKAERRRLKEQGIKPQNQLKALRKWKEGNLKGRIEEIKREL